MTRLPARLVEDRALRDAAREVLIADLEHARAALSHTSMATRVAGRISGGAQEVLESAIEQAGQHRGIVAGLIALIIVWFARTPLLGLLGWRGANEAGEREAEGSKPVAPRASAGEPAQAAGEPLGEALAEAANSAAKASGPAQSPITGENHD